MNNLFSRRSIAAKPVASDWSAIEEAQSLVRRCAEPRPVGDKVKAAILRASRRLQFPISRTKDVWYGQARRIDAREMDRLRQVAEKTELAVAAGSVELVRRTLLTSRSASDREVATALDAALRGLGSDENGNGFQE
jgi:hypothetical protein